MIATYTTFWSPGRGGLELGAEQQETAIHKMAMAVPTEMQSLRTLYRTINLVQKRYIDATRIDSRVMFVAAMRAVQGQVAKVLVSEENDELLVRLGTEERRFALGDVTTPWILLQRVKEVFSFWEKALSEDEVDLREVEYAAINGMLQTLDPHSVFLTPDQYRDMKDKTQGKFGGLGISIGIRDGVLTIISPIKGTPAHLAGLRAGDQIHKIDEISTVNITLNDAVGILRGDPGTAVTVYILRKGWQEPRPFEITRAIIKVESLESHLLGGRVGYLQIKDFQSNTPRDIGEQFEKFKQKGIRGLVLDLRGCPGGLLDAAIKVADLFLKTGVIVTTAGQGPTDRDVRRADADGNEPKYPIVVLVSRGSASASEIVAGALKSHDRALLVGERTFGKGSVQVLYDFHDGSALKLTTAQYLTPGDVSIQSVGVVPHVELLPMRADKEMLDLQIETGYRESDLDHHFEDARVSKVEDQPRKRLRYLWTPTARAREATTGPADAGVAPFSGEDEPFKPDFAIELARDLVVKMTRNQSEKINFKGLSKTLEERSKKEEQKLVSALKNLGIDWREGSDTGQASIEATARLVQPDPLEAGTEDALIVSVTNKGTNTTHRLLATSQSDFRPLDDRELAFGRIEPGETLDRELKFRVPKDAIDQTNDVLWSFSSASNKNLDPVALRFSVKALERPRFAYSFQVVDTEGGNGDSRLQPGESVKLVVDVENVGKGAALDAYATLKGLSGKELFMIQGREALKKLEPGERRRSVFAFEIKPTFGEDKARFELVMADVDLRVYSLEKISIPIAQPLEVRPVSKVVSASAGPIQVLSEPDPKASIVAKLPSGTAVDVEAETGSFYRIRLDDIRVGWISNSAVTAEAIGEKRSAELIVNAPPKLIIEELDQVVQSPTISIRGKAVDEARVRDVYIFVGTNKVFFKPNADPTNPGELSFEAELPLDHGLNYVAVVAEETADLDTREVITIRRDGPDGMSYLQPRAPNGEPEPLGVIPTTNSVLID
ncbi:MAG: SH3 domain-containing protein [Proteobacteria bacterium]|nr:SH3 domain-containing protein [Pseudomonadota bacterium]